MIDTERLANFARENDLEFVALFGSRARGRSRPGSDYDLALEPCRWNAPGGRLQAGLALARALGRGDADAAWLPHASRSHPR